LQRPDLGRVAEGCVGDLLIVDGNPFDDPAVLWGPPGQRTVVQAGAVVSV
jgi:imidazolonepropionase-like amidohydrolase